MTPPFCSLRMALSSVRLLPHIILFRCSRNRLLMQADMRAWAPAMGLGNPKVATDWLWLFIFLMTFTPEFRNLFYLRAGRWSRLCAILCPRLSSLDIAPTTIGPGLFIQHGECTYVSARRIGANCWIGRQVVVGYAGEDQYPTIGDNVRIFAGAKIVGNVTIGDGATIGLNTVITDNVPAGATMLGVPGRVIWRTLPEKAVTATGSAAGMLRAHQRPQAATHLLRSAPKSEIGDDLQQVRRAKAEGLS
jgi:serine O-acetyltransferase